MDVCEAVIAFILSPVGFYEKAIQFRAVLKLNQPESKQIKGHKVIICVVIKRASFVYIIWSY